MEIFFLIWTISNSSYLANFHFTAVLMELKSNVSRNYRWNEIIRILGNTDCTIDNIILRRSRNDLLKMNKRRGLNDQKYILIKFIYDKRRGRAITHKSWCYWSSWIYLYCKLLVHFLPAIITVYMYIEITHYGQQG